ADEQREAGQQARGQVVRQPEGQGGARTRSVGVRVVGGRGAGPDLRVVEDAVAEALDLALDALAADGAAVEAHVELLARVAGRAGDDAFEAAGHGGDLVGAVGAVQASQAVLLVGVALPGGLAGVERAALQLLGAEARGVVAHLEARAARGLEARVLHAVERAESAAYEVDARVLGRLVTWEQALQFDAGDRHVRGLRPQPRPLYEHPLMCCYGRGPRHAARVREATARLGCPRLPELLRVRDHPVEHRPDVVVGQPVVDVPPALGEGHQPRAPERAQLVAHRRLRHRQHLDDLVHAHLALA